MATSTPEAGPVCVTGATGYIASYVVKLLLERGYTVRGTTRSAAPEKVAHLTSLPGAAERLTLLEADLLTPGAFDEAVAGCVGVYHMASPFFLEGQSEALMIPPAVDGTKNVLGSCTRHAVRKVVLTSSTAAIYVQFGAKPKAHVYSEADWSHDERMRAHNAWYCISKTEAEKAATAQLAEAGIPLAVMNPCLVIGPMLQPTLNTSCAAVLSYMSGKRTQVEATPKAIVDVRDVALAHVLGMETEGYVGRTMLVGASFPWADAQPWLAAAVPECAGAFPAKQQDPASLPAPEHWAMAVPGEHVKYDCSKAEALGVVWTSAEDSITATALDLKRHAHYSA
jgi:nucleoside-diphosphate-sugar epimerase